MAEKILNTRIQLKYDSYDNWMSNDPKLKKGEVAIVTIATDETNKYGQVIPTTLMKVGDGTRKFSELDWVAGKAADVYSWAKAESLAYDALPKTLRDEIDALQEAIGANGSVAKQISDAIGLLDVADAEVDGQYVSAVSETDGKIVVTRKALPVYTLVEGTANGTVKFNGADVAVHGLKSAAYAEASAFDEAGAASAVEGKLDAYKESNNAAVALKADKTALEAEVGRATGVEAGLQSAIDAINNADSGILAQAKTYADGKDSAIQDAQDAADAAQGDVDELAGLVGSLPEGATATTVFGYIEEKTTGIASEENLGKLAERVGVVEGKVSTIENDYLKAADKEELSGAINSEKERAMGVEGGLETRLAKVEGDYLKGSDKEELEGKINLKANQAALEAEIDRAQKAEKANADAIALLTNGVDSETIDGVNDLIAYVTEHGAEVTGMKADIKQNADDIDSLEGRMDDAEEALGTVDSRIAAAITGANLGQYALESDLDKAVERVGVVEGKVTVNEGKIATLEAKFGGAEGSVEDMIADAKAEAISTAAEDAQTKLETANSYTDAAVEALPIKVVNLADSNLRPWEYETGIYKFVTEAAYIQLKVINGEVGSATESLGYFFQQKEIFLSIVKYQATTKHLAWGVAVLMGASNSAYHASRSFTIQLESDTTWKSFKSSAVPGLADKPEDAGKVVRVKSDSKDYELVEMVASVNGKTGDVTIGAEDLADVYSQSEIDTKLSGINSSITDITNGSTPVKEADHATKATQDASGNDIVATYATKSELGTAKSDLEKYADQAEADAKAYADGLAGNYATAAQGAKADSAIQGVTAGEGLKATKTGNSVEIAFDEEIVFVFDCGNSKF